MIFEYPNYGGTGVRVDTESREYQNKRTYVAGVIGATDARERVATIAYPFPGAGQQFKIEPSLSIVFTVPNTAQTEADGTVSCDAAGLILDPRAAANSLLFCLGREMNAPEYKDPDADKPALNDWEVPGSKIGPPMYGDFFKFKWTGEAVGAKVQGASGRIYELVRLPGLFTAYAWRGL